MSTGIGDTLRAARREQGHQLADVAAETRIRESYLAALEHDHFDGLGGDVYVRGFITSYARFLGLEVQPLLQAFDALRDEEEQARRSASAEPKRTLPPGVRPMTKRPAGAAVLAGLALLVMLVLVLVGLFGLGVGEGGALETDGLSAQIGVPW